MKERLAVLALAAGALALLYVLFNPKPQRDPLTEALVFPLTTESRPDGLLAAWRWLAEQRVPEASLRYRYDRLPASLPSRTGNLLIMTMPQRVPARRAELGQLQKWIEAGNTLLILAAVDDKPLWAVAGDAAAKDKLKLLTGLDLAAGGLGAAMAATLATDISRGKVESIDITPRGEHPLLAGVGHVQALSLLKLTHPAPEGRFEVMPLELAARSDTQVPALWLLRRGAGQIILSSAASLFSNRGVVLADNARLLANIVAWCRGEGGTVVFDDSHQGLTAFYDAGAFYADPRLHRTLLWIVVLWLAFVLGALPLRAAQPQQLAVDETFYVEGSAGYFAAVVPPGEAAQRLVERFLEELRGPGRTGVPLWERFDEHPRLSGAQRRALHKVYEKACSGARIDLARLQNLLARLRGIVES